MIVEYHRPEELSEALALLARPAPRTLPLGGGTVLSRLKKPDFAVVDLQRLGLNKMETEGQLLHIGSTATLQQIFESDLIPASMREGLRDSLLHEVAVNLRRTATIAGLLVSCDGRSPFVTGLLVLDARIIWSPGEDAQSLGDYLPLREEFGRGRLITDVRIPLNPTLRFATVARAPMDRPVVCAAVAAWPSGRTRVTLGGFGKAPILAMDGPEPVGAAVAAREAYRFAGDEWASAAYRMETAGKLVQRLIADIKPRTQTSEPSASESPVRAD
jgi:CO/xanthine dehydrogenase FAD-binding subunit